MLVKIKKWGNSKGVRIQKSILDKSGIHENDEVEIMAQKDKIILLKRVQVRKKYKLHDLVKKMPKTYTLEKEVWNTSEGNEIW